MNNLIVDLCCGAGGFSLGAHLAGFSTHLAIDIDQDLTSSWDKNFPSSRLIHADISKLNEDFWKEHLAHVKPIGVIGGPPCQGFSRIGKGDASDPRNSLVTSFAMQVNLIDPSFFVMENVEGLLDEKNKLTLNTASFILAKNYKIIGPILIDAADHGAPTKRKRAVLIGYKPNEFKKIEASDFLGQKVKRKHTIRDAIADLPSPININGRCKDYIWADYPSSTPISQYARNLRVLPHKDLGWDIVKKALTEGKVTGVNGTRHTAVVEERFTNVKPGTVDAISRFPRLHWDKQAPTLRAGTGKDRGSFQSVRPIHPSEPRVITVREAARIQGFPDWFVFHPTIWHSFRMIGNSVSPIFAKSILKIIFDKIDDTKKNVGKA